MFKIKLITQISLETIDFPLSVDRWDGSVWLLLNWSTAFDAIHHSILDTDWNCHILSGTLKHHWLQCLHSLIVCTCLSLFKYSPVSLASWQTVCRIQLLSQISSGHAKFLFTPGNLTLYCFPCLHSAQLCLLTLVKVCISINFMRVGPSLTFDTVLR